MTSEEILLSIITLLVAAIGYFVKKTYDKLEKVASDVAEIKPKVEILWIDKLSFAHSPRQLNETGNRILEESGIKEMIDEKKHELLKMVKEKKAANAYDAERAIEDVLEKLPQYFPGFVDRLKDGAFRSGTDISALLFVGSIYLRNQIFDELGFSLTDLDASGKS